MQAHDRSLGETSMRWPEKHYLASERHRFLYIPIGKVACSSLKSWIVSLELGEEALRGVEVHGLVREQLELGTYHPDRAEAILSDRSLLRFAFVRNPWDRLVSGFLQKFISHIDSPARHFIQRVERRRGWHRWMHWLSAGWIGERLAASGDDLFETLTFRQFVAELKHFDSAAYDTHWRPQYLFLAGQDIDFLGRFERLAEDFAALKAKLGVGGQLPEVNCTPRGIVTTECLSDWPLAKLRTLPQFPSYSQFYTADLVASVAEIYAEDIRRFDYPFAAARRSRAA